MRRGQHYPLLGRRREFGHSPEFADPAGRLRIPDPNDPSTFASAILDWSDRQKTPHRVWLDRDRALLRIRREEIVPRLAGAAAMPPAPDTGDRVVAAGWVMGDGSRLTLVANLSAEWQETTADSSGRDRILYSTGRTSPIDGAAPPADGLPPWSVQWRLG